MRFRRSSINLKNNLRRMFRLNHSNNRRKLNRNRDLHNNRINRQHKTTKTNNLPTTNNPHKEHSTPLNPSSRKTSSPNYPSMARVRLNKTTNKSNFQQMFSPQLSSPRYNLIMASPTKANGSSA
jgi:hypothetical protein